MAKLLVMARQKAGLTQAQLAEKVSTTQSQIQRLETGQRKLSLEWARKLAPHLRIDPVSLFVGEDYAKQIDSVNASVTLVPVRGKVAAGLWMLHDDIVDEVDIPAIPRKDGLEQFAFQVSGNSMDKLGILHDWYVVCVPYWLSREALTQDDIVVVERRNGQLVERTCKQIALTPTHYELWPRSSDARWQEPIRILRTDPEKGEDGTEVEVVGRVVWKCAPV